jgi:hypothetical protein
MADARAVRRALKALKDSREFQNASEEARTHLLETTKNDVKAKRWDMN